MLLDLLTMFFIVGGCVLLWLTFRTKRPRIVPTKADDPHPQTAHAVGSRDNFPVSGPKQLEPHQSAPIQQGLDKSEKHPLIDVLEQHLLEAEANPAAGDNAYANRVAAGIVKARKNEA